MTATSVEPATSDKQIEKQTGELFSALWSPYDDELFESSVQLFRKRLDLAGFDADWFQGKTVLDAGCGGGRNSIAMARLGASSVTGIDVGEDGLVDARKRAEKYPNVSFQVGSVLELPFEDKQFDMVWCAGVLMHTVDGLQGIKELSRVIKPGGLLYVLVYASGGLRWPLIQLLRPLAGTLGFDAIEQAVQAANLPANKRRTFLDDLFVPNIDFYTAQRISSELRSEGFEKQTRWPAKCSLDHEESLDSYHADLSVLADIFESGKKRAVLQNKALFEQCHQLTSSVLTVIADYRLKVTSGEISPTEARKAVIGQGHHRIMSVRS